MFLETLSNSNIDLKFKLIILIGLHTGMRVGEICALRPSDIDIKRKVIMVNRTTTRDEHGHVALHKADTTKTENSCREIPVNEEVEHYLKIAKNNFIFNPNQLLFWTNDLGIDVYTQISNDKKKEDVEKQTKYLQQRGQKAIFCSMNCSIEIKKEPIIC